VSATSKTAELDIREFVNFGLLRLGSQSSRTVIIRNDVSASARLNLTGVAVIGQDSDAFTTTDPNRVGQDTTEKTELAPGEAAEVTVTLRPERTGRQVAALVIQTDDPRQPGQAVFLSNTQTIGFSTFGTVNFNFENIQAAELPVLPSVSAGVDNQVARITRATPAIDTTNQITISYQGTPAEQGAPNGDNESIAGVDAIRYVDITQTENLSESTFINNTIEFSVAQTTLTDRPADADDVELYQYNGSGYEPISTSAPDDGDDGQDFRYTATYSDLERDLMIATGAPNVIP
jgi:hypothetical protein